MHSVVTNDFTFHTTIKCLLKIFMPLVPGMMIRRKYERIIKRATKKEKFATIFKKLACLYFTNTFRSNDDSILVCKNRLVTKNTIAY